MKMTGGMHDKASPHDKMEDISAPTKADERAFKKVAETVGPDTGMGKTARKGHEGNMPGLDASPAKAAEALRQQHIEHGHHSDESKSIHHRMGSRHKDGKHY